MGKRDGEEGLLRTVAIHKISFPKPAKNIRLFLTVFIIFSLSVPVGTVSAKVPDTGEEEWGFSAIFYDNSNGLPASEANAIAQSRNGFIWIGGYSGLIRYDGNDFYRLDSSAGITSLG